MKPHVALILLAATVMPGVAHAACSTASLAGNWRLIATDGTGSSFCNVAITSAGVVTGTCSSGSAASGKIALSSACAISGKVLGQVFTGRTEALETSSKLVPNIITGSGNPPVGGIVAYRK